MQKLSVLSLFDGISCGRVALDRVGLQVANYFSSEIDNHAITISQINYPDIIRLGDVCLIDDSKLKDLPKIDLMLVGSPCQGFSTIGTGLNFNHPQSKLFFEFIRILNWIRTNNNSKVRFILENVKMKKEYFDIISDYTGVVGKIINSKLVSAQKRERYYWTNIAYSEYIEDKGIMLEEVLEKGKVADEHYCKEHQMEHFHKCKYVRSEYKSGVEIYDFYNRSIKYGKSNTVTPHCFRKDRSACNIVKDNYGVRRLTPVECERLQNLPDNYTNHISMGARYKAIGNGWTVDVISHILQGLK